MPESLVVPLLVPALKQHFRALRLVMLIEAGTHLIFDAIIVSHKYGRASKGIKIVAFCFSGNATDVG